MRLKNRRMASCCAGRGPSRVPVKPSITGISSEYHRYLGELLAALGGSLVGRAGSQTIRSTTQANGGCIRDASSPIGAGHGSDGGYKLVSFLDLFESTGLIKLGFRAEPHPVVVTLIGDEMMALTERKYRTARL